MAQWPRKEKTGLFYMPHPTTPQKKFTVRLFMTFLGILLINVGKTLWHKLIMWRAWKKKNSAALKLFFLTYLKNH